MMAAIDLWSAQLHTAGSRKNTFELWRMALGSRFVDNAILAFIIVAVSLLIVVGATITFGGPLQTEPRLNAQWIQNRLERTEESVERSKTSITDHEARLRENERYHVALDSLKLGERMAVVETNQRLTIYLLLVIIASLIPLLIERGIAVIRGQSRPSTTPSA